MNTRKTTVVDDNALIRFDQSGLQIVAGKGNA